MIPHINVIEFLQWVKKNFKFSVLNRGWVKLDPSDKNVYTEKLVYNEYIKYLENKK